MRNITKIAFYILLIGCLLVLVSPFLFTRSLGLISFSNTGEIGDTIGGITAPITSIIGSVLVFFALRAQIDANRIIQSQIEDQKLDDKRKKEAQYISELYSYFLRSIEGFKYSESTTIGSYDTIRAEVMNYYGNEAIYYFMRDYERMNHYSQAHDDEVIFRNPKMLELTSILKSADILINRLYNSGIDQDDKKFTFYH